MEWKYLPIIQAFAPLLMGEQSDGIFHISSPPLLVDVLNMFIQKNAVKNDATVSLIVFNDTCNWE